MKNRMERESTLSILFFFSYLLYALCTYVFIYQMFSYLFHLSNFNNRTGQLIVIGQR